MNCGNEQKSKYGSEKSNSCFQTGSKKCVPIRVAAFLCGNSRAPASGAPREYCMLSLELVLWPSWSTGPLPLTHSGHVSGGFLPKSHAGHQSGYASLLKLPLGHTHGLSPVTDECIMLPAESLTSMRTYALHFSSCNRENKTTSSSSCWFSSCSHFAQKRNGLRGWTWEVSPCQTSLYAQNHLSLPTSLSLNPMLSLCAWKSIISQQDPGLLKLQTSGRLPPLPHLQNAQMCVNSRAHFR